MVSDVLALELSDLRVVEGDIVVQVIAIDQAVVSNDGNAPLFGRRHNGSRLNAIGRRDNQDAISLCQVCLSLRHLSSGAALRVVVVNSGAGELLLDVVDQVWPVVGIPAGRGGRLRQQHADLLAVLAAVGVAGGGGSTATAGAAVVRAAASGHEEREQKNTDHHTEGLAMPVKYVHHIPVLPSAAIVGRRAFPSPQRASHTKHVQHRIHPDSRRSLLSIFANQPPFFRRCRLSINGGQAASASERWPEPGPELPFPPPRWPPPRERPGYAPRP